MLLAALSAGTKTKCLLMLFLNLGVPKYS